LNTGDLRTGLPTALAGLQYKVLGKLGKMEDDIKLVKSEGNIIRPQFWEDMWFLKKSIKF
jgi:hypothetical protein